MTPSPKKRELPNESVAKITQPVGLASAGAEDLLTELQLEQLGCEMFPVEVHGAVEIYLVQRKPSAGSGGGVEGAVCCLKACAEAKRKRGSDILFRSFVKNDVLCYMHLTQVTALLTDRDGFGESVYVVHLKKKHYGCHAASWGRCFCIGCIFMQ